MSSNTLNFYPLKSFFRHSILTHYLLKMKLKILIFDVVVLKITYIFFLELFLPPLVSLLFFPTAIFHVRGGRGRARVVFVLIWNCG